MAFYLETNSILTHCRACWTENTPISSSQWDFNRETGKLSWQADFEALGKPGWAMQHAKTEQHAQLKTNRMPQWIRNTNVVRINRNIASGRVAG